MFAFFYSYLSAWNSLEIEKTVISPWIVCVFVESYLTVSNHLYSYLNTFLTISAISVSYGNIKRYRRIFGFQNEYTIGVIIWKAIRMCGNTLTESSNFIRPMKWYMYESSCRNSKDYLSALRIEIQKINTQKPAFISNVSYDRDWSKHNLKKCWVMPK